MRKVPLSKTKKFFLALCDTLKDEGELFVDLFRGMTDPSYYGALKHGGAPAVRARRLMREEQQRKRLFYALKQRQWLTTRRVGDRLLYRLTEKGKRILLKERIQHAPSCPPTESIIVIFDIPEQERKVREQFRYFLKECQFVQLQRSVWMSCAQVLPFLQEFIRSTKSGAWIRAFRAIDVANDRQNL